MKPASRLLVYFGLVATLATGLPDGARAQGESAQEVELLRTAARQEAFGDLAGAEELLRQVLETHPTSAPALLAMQRVLRARGRLEEVVPLLETAVAQAPRSVSLNQLRLRTYAALDRIDDVERAGRQWITVVPLAEAPYREVARIWTGRGRHDRAREVLEEGRRAVGRRDALALAMGDVLAVTGEPRAAVREWARAIDADGRGLIEVRQRLREHPGVRPYLPELLERLTAEDPSAGRMAAVRDLALMFGDSLVAVEGPATARERPAGDTVVGPGRAAAALRIEITAQDDPDAALRALRSFQEEHPEARELDRLAAVVADALVGDGRRVEAERLLDDAAGPRSTALGARLLLERGHVERARAAYTTAAGGLEGVDATRALRMATLLDRVSESAASVVGRALRAEDDGRPDEAVELLVRAVDGRTETPEGRSTGTGGPLTAADVPPLLELAARLADEAGRDSEAVRIRQRIVADHADAAEAPAALLALGTALADRGRTRAQARAYLERLITGYPRSALVPQARRALERLAP